MKINFYTDNEQKAATVETFLFDDDYGQMMEGQKIEHSGAIYQVNALQWADDNRKLLNAFIWKYPAKL